MQKYYLLNGYQLDEESGIMCYNTTKEQYICIVLYAVVLWYAKESNKTQKIVQFSPQSSCLYEKILIYPWNT